MSAERNNKTNALYAPLFAWWNVWFDLQWKYNKCLQIATMPVIPPDFWRIEETFLKAGQENLSRLLHVPFQGEPSLPPRRLPKKEALLPQKQKERLLLTKVLE